MADAFLVVIRAVMYPPLYVKLVPFVNIPFHNFSQAPVQNNVVPVCTVRHLCSVLKGISTLRRRKRKGCYRLVVVIIAHCRLFPYIACELYLILVYTKVELNYT